MPRLPLPLLALLAALLTVAIAGCGSDAAETDATTPVACRSVPAPEARSEPTLRKPTARLAPSLDWRAVVTTNCGTFTIALAVDASPRTTGSFAALAREGFYDGLAFHRVAPGFVIQGGDPLGTGTGGPGYTITEAPPRATRYTRGVVAMAKTATDPDGSSGSQFFVVTGEDAQLPPQYALLGTVTEGLDVIDQIDASPLEDTDPQGSRPVRPIVIERVTITSD